MSKHLDKDNISVQTNLHSRWKPFEVSLYKYANIRMMRTYRHMYIHSCTHTHTYTYAHTHAHTYTHVHMYTQKPSFRACVVAVAKAATARFVTCGAYEGVQPVPIMASSVSGGPGPSRSPLFFTVTLAIRSRPIIAART